MIVSLTTILSLANGFQITKYSFLGSFTFLLYDQILAFDREVEYIWKKKWKFSSCLYLIARYLSLFSLTFDIIIVSTGSLTDAFCQGFLRWHLAINDTTILLGQIILITRVHAVFNRNWTVTGPAIVTSVLTIGGNIAFEITGLPQMAPSPFPFTGCFLYDMSPIFAYAWLPTFIFETVLCALIIYKGIVVYLQNRKAPILRVIARDRTYYVWVLAGMLVNALMWGIGPQSLYLVAITWQQAALCVMSSRLLLNVRERVNKLPCALPIVSNSRIVVLLSHTEQ